MKDASQMLNILKNSFVEENNTMGVDFELYSSMDDLQNGVNQWKFCNYGSNYGFPYECGPEELTPKMWNSWDESKKGEYGTQVAFYIYTAEDNWLSEWMM